MSNRLLAILVLVLIFGGLYGAYYYFFVANVGTISVIVTGVGTGTVAVEMRSDLKQTYGKDCEKLCTFTDMPPVGYHLTAKTDGYVTVEKSFSVTRGQIQKVIVRMDREVKLSEIASPTDNIDDADTGTTTLDTVDTGSISTNTSIITSESGPIETVAGEPIHLDGTIYSVKDTQNPSIKLITTDKGVFTYSTEDTSTKQNPLYDDLLPLASGDLIALIRKTSRDKLSLLNLDANGHDYIIRVNIEKHSRTVLLQTPADGKYLDYRGGKVILIDMDGKKYAVENAE